MEKSPLELSPAQRRAFLQGLTSSIALGLSACAATAMGGAGPNEAQKEKGEKEEEETEVSPAEDLMQEHGILNRVLLVYDEAIVRLEHGTDFDRSHLDVTTQLVQRFIEEYHEKQEEDYVFPKLEKAGKETALVATLRAQHKRGRELTLAIQQAARGGSAPDPAALAAHLRAYTRMYRAHASREDTVAFRAFRNLFENDDYRELGELFEKREHQVLGEGGYEKALATIEQVEQALAIHDLAAFTPPSVV